MLKARTLFPYLKKIAFPQRDFARAIIRHLKKEEMSSHLKRLVDAPSGIGQTTYCFAKAFPNAKITGIDIDPTFIQYAATHLHRPNIQYAVHDLKNISGLNLPKVDAFCVINSIFLLPEMERLLNDVFDLLNHEGWLVLLIPNIESNNYKHFVSKISGTLNVREFSAEEAEAVIAPFRFRLLKTEPVIHIRIFGGIIRQAIIFFFPFLVRLIESRMKHATPAYYILYFKPTK